MVSCFSYVAAQKKQPNFVFFLVDDMGWMDFSHNGSTFYETPNVDRLADEGVKFNQGYATCHVCSPTRASIMTGKYPARTHTTNYFCGKRKGELTLPSWNCEMDTSEVTIAEALKAGGYKTCFLGKWHLGGGNIFWPKNQGFDVNFGGHARGGPGAGGYFSPYNNPRLTDGMDGEYLTDRLGAEAAKWIEENQDSPFFTYLSFYAVHTPIAPKPDIQEYFEYKKDTITFPNRPANVIVKNEDDWIYNAKNIQNNTGYASMLKSMDKAVGVVLDKLEELNLNDQTIVIFTSDNGGLSTTQGTPTSNTPLKAGKGWLYEGGIREPWIIKWPHMVTPGSIQEAPVISNDFYPTILEMAGLDPKPDQHIDGVSLVPLLRQEGKLNRKALFWHYPHYSDQGGRPAGAIHMGNFKLIERYEDNSLELYNLKDDIGEKNNLAQVADFSTLVDILLYELHTWRDSVQVQMNPGHVAQPTPTRPDLAGCIKVRAENYNVFATQDDGSCIIKGCTDSLAENYDPEANLSDKSCKNSPIDTFGLHVHKKVIIQTLGSRISIKLLKGTANIVIRDVTGNVVFQKNKVQAIEQVESKKLVKGIYFININHISQKVLLL